MRHVAGPVELGKAHEPVALAPDADLVAEDLLDVTVGGAGRALAAARPGRPPGATSVRRAAVSSRSCIQPWTHTARSSSFSSHVDVRRVVVVAGAKHLRQRRAAAPGAALASSCASGNEPLRSRLGATAVHRKCSASRALRGIEPAQLLAQEGSRVDQLRGVERESWARAERQGQPSAGRRAARRSGSRRAAGSRPRCRSTARAPASRRRAPGRRARRTRLRAPAARAGDPDPASSRTSPASQALRSSMSFIGRGSARRASCARSRSA